MERQHTLPVKRFRTDNGGEYVNRKLQRFFADKGIVHNFTPAYSPESNGVAERFNRTMGEAVRAMVVPLTDPRLWADAVSTFVYLKNRQPHKAIKDQTPYEAFFGKKPTIHHLQPFGRECYVHIPKDKRPSGSKLLPRASHGIFIGYTDVDHHYRVWLPVEKRTVISSDVFFPPLISEGVPQVPSYSHVPQPPMTSNSASTSTSISYSFNKEGFPTEDMWYAWMDRNPQLCAEWYTKGHPIVVGLVQKEYAKGKHYEFIDPENPQDNIYEDPDSPFPPSSSSSSSNDDSLYRPPSQENRYRSPDQHSSSSDPLNESIHSYHSSDFPDRNRLPSDRPTHPPPPPQQYPDQGPYRTRYGREIHPPGEWWKVKPNIEASSSSDESLPDAPPPSRRLSPIQENKDDSMESALLSILDVLEQKSYSAAKSSADWPHWKRAMNEELESLKENNVWDVVDRPNRKIVDCRWVYKVKGNAKGEVERYKARLVAKGFSQVMGQDYDEIFSPVVRFDSLRLLLAISASKGWRVRQLDVKTAFLYRILKEEVYMQLPEGSRLEGKVARLRRCIYGLKQSPREWYFRLVEYLIPYGFAVTAFDPCVLIHSTGDLIIAIYVDDLTLFGPPGKLVDSTVSLLKAKFKVNDMGLLHYLLGIQIDYTKEGISLSQSAFIDKILNQFKMQDCNPVSTPIDPNHRLVETREEDEKANATAYQQIIGSLMYLVTATRPDLAYTITHLSQFNSNPSTLHFNAAKRVIRYLKKTKERTLFYPFKFDLRLSSFVDASYSNCYNTRRSFSGYLFQFGPCSISWRSRKQRSVATSTCEAEYMALAMTTKHHLWLTRGLKELMKDNIPHAIFCDSNAAIDVSNNPKLNDRTKHIDIAYHFTRERIIDGSITLMHVPSADNLADICTKGLTRQIHDHLCTEIFGTK